ncbi:FAD-dependent oxidoreductase [Congregibacter brevis]|uniref:FAD-dependent oxidoreductase n=1 Tax=Congregibacter brevis TaxID=3081201 RepID=A0ABZ0IE42_9GAMM|nr:FAD-dependent oxidoreductase [Congregibacter sp. IMCC45268]
MGTSDKTRNKGRVEPAGITRRDFLHDVSLASIALAAPGFAKAVATETADDGRLRSTQAAYYPPTRTGMRGAHPGAFEVAHELAREGKAFDNPTVLNEHYDLVIVGAGISGLAAAYFYRQQHGLDSKILLLDNHDDFGGHAKRNEFQDGDSLRLAWGGTVNIEYPKYSEEGLRLLKELGIDIPRLLKDFDYNWTDNGTGLSGSTWFDRDTYGDDVLIPGLGFQSLSPQQLLDALPRMPISDSARTALRRFLSSKDDALAGLTGKERAAYTRQTRYADFLREKAELPDEAIQIFSNATMGGWGIRADDLSVAECLESGLPGLHILGLAEEDGPDEDYRSAMFPDGNASIARLIVKSLIPDSFPSMTAASDPFEIVTARLDYAELDKSGSSSRLRLNSTVVGVRNSDSGKTVDVKYVRDGELVQVSGDQCVLACYNRIIPHLCPELPETQKTALSECIKRPMVCINVLLKDGSAIQKSGVSQAYLPGRMLQLVNLASGINTGAYDGAWNPEEPCVLHFFAAMGAEQPEGLTISQQNQAGRIRLLQMDFADFESEVHTVLSGVWGSAGLDTQRDIQAITVNRWPHGYARDLADLEDARWLASPGPYEIGRQTFGNIAVANSDAGADAYTHTAIDQAWRAVQELPVRS